MNSRNITYLVAGLLIGAILGSLIARGMNSDRNVAPSSSAETVSTPAPASNVYVPNLDRIRNAITLAQSWLEKTPVHPTRDGLKGFRNHALEVHSWHLLYLFERQAVKKTYYRDKIREAVERHGQGEKLVALLEDAPVRKYIADILIVVQAAREVGVELSAIESALPELIEKGLQAPNRPVGLQVPLALLIRDLGYDAGPDLSELRTRGMLAEARTEVGMIELDVYILTHEIFGFSDYGLRKTNFDPAEQAYLKRTLPFWTLFSAVMYDPDLGAELAICHQVVGMMDEHAYGQSMALLVASQSPEGFFQKQKPVEAAVDNMHTLMVGLQALLGHEALRSGHALPLDR